MNDSFELNDWWIRDQTKKEAILKLNLLLYLLHDEYVSETFPKRHLRIADRFKMTYSVR